jgi:hypothetical protein
VNVEKQPVERAADQLRIGAVRLRAGVGVLVVGAVDPAAQQLLFVITVRPLSLASTRSWSL